MNHLCYWTLLLRQVARYFTSILILNKTAGIVLVYWK